MPSPSLETALVRLLVNDKTPRKPVGAGFLVTPNHVLTCAHVINDALRRKQNASECPDVTVLLDFPLIKNQPLMSAKIIKWFPVQDDSAVGKIEDIAVLELLPDVPLPAEAHPVPVVVLDDKSFTEHRVRMCGFPVGVDDGTYANGRLQGLTAKGWVEIHHNLDSGIVEEGFSGTAVWAIMENAVCGMTVSMLSRQKATTAYMIPASTLINAFPELDKLSRPENPYRGLEAFREKDAKFYFGRGETIDLLKQTVLKQPFVPVIGASGSGKSSVVFAGLLPELRKTGNWLIADFRPKNQPFYEMASCLIPFLYDDKMERIEKTKECAHKLYSGAFNLSDLIQEIVRENNNMRFLLIVDQFEELYTLTSDKTTAQRFIDRLLESIKTEIFTVLLTMRADFMSQAIIVGESIE
ncbi:MAG TPA: serine protease, partial [Thermodesulfovibrionia bacterium]|nr:serine protease [Thermodesulfovibrionia bacterium]